MSRIFSLIIYITIISCNNTQKIDSIKSSKSSSDIDILLQNYSDMILEFDSVNNMQVLNKYDKQGLKQQSIYFGDHGKLGACVFYKPGSSDISLVIKYDSIGIPEVYRGKHLFISSKYLENPSQLKDTFSVLIFAALPPKFATNIKLVSPEDGSIPKIIFNKNMQSNNPIEYVEVFSNQKKINSYYLVSETKSLVDTNFVQNDTLYFDLKKKQ